LTGVPQENGMLLLIDLVFDRHGYLFAFDTRNEVLFQFTPSPFPSPSTEVVTVKPH